MRGWTIGLLGLLLAGGAGSVAAQAPVAGAADPDALFTSPDPRLNANKQAAYHIVKDLIEAGHWEQADRWLTARYIQHNPMAKSGRAEVVEFFTKVMKATPKPIAPKLKTGVVAVVAEGDYVTVVYPRAVPAAGGKPAYSTTWFDMWRFVDGKADEHWDPAMLP